MSPLSSAPQDCKTLSAELVGGSVWVGGCRPERSPVGQGYGAEGPASPGPVVVWTADLVSSRVRQELWAAWRRPCTLGHSVMLGEDEAQVGLGLPMCTRTTVCDS